MRQAWTKLLRSWQTRALLVTRAAATDCLIMATPGAGKTTLALRVAHDQLDRGQVQRVVIVCPTDHLRTQWTRAAARWLLVMTAWLLGVVAVGLWVVGI